MVFSLLLISTQVSASTVFPSVTCGLEKASWLVYVACILYEPTYGGKACLVDAFHVAIESQQKRRFPAEIFRLERQVSDEGAWDCHTNADEGLYVSRNIQWPLLQHRALYLPLA